MATNIKELIAGIEVELEASVKREQKARREVEVILASAQQEGRSNLTEDEDARTEELFSQIELAKSQQDGIKRKLANARRVEAEEAEAEVRLQDIQPTSAKRSAKPKYDEVFRVGEEERAYNKGVDPTGRQFLSDVCRQYLFGDVGAQTRLARHMQEERVERGPYLERANDTTANFSGLTVPQYLTDMVAPATAGMKPFADLCTNQHQLPVNGMSVNISKITTPSQAGLQPTGELNNLPSQTAQDTLLTIPVQTAGGYVNVSRQAIDRGTGIDDVILQDLFKRYYTDMDNQLLNQASTGLTNIAQSTAATTGTTGPGVYSALMGAMARLEATLLGYGTPTHVVFNPRRWYWLASQMASTWPIIAFQQPSVPENQIGAANANGYGSNIRGVLPNGLGVVVDANVTTTVSGTQDEIYVVAKDECHLWTDSNQPAFIRAEQPNAPQLGVLLVVYGYYAYTFNRYTNAQQKVTSTSFTAPTF